MPPPVDFDSVSAVTEFVTSVYRKCYRNSDDAWIRRIFADADDLFCGRTADFLAIDLKYHNLRHTLMVAVCMAEILEGHNLEGSSRPLESREFELGIAAVLLHDAGYLKLRTDTQGTGAKYTFCHILRSCAFAATYLPRVGASAFEVENVISAINCTGPTSEIGRLYFSGPWGRTLGASLATADYLAQLADPMYPDKLGELYLEFKESDDYANIPISQRPFPSEEELVLRTPGFWSTFVKPKLDRDFDSAYRLLERPIGSGQNSYLDAIERNFAEIGGRVARMKA
jgi:hypothetical protein